MDASDVPESSRAPVTRIALADVADNWCDVCCPEQVGTRDEGLADVTLTFPPVTLA